jgi:branched-chain amino acid transport system substrate-binding protein
MFLIAGELDVALPALDQLRAMGFSGALLGGDGLLGLEEEAPDASGVYISTAFLPDQPGADAQRFVQAYQQRYDALPTGDAALAYDAVNVVLHAIGQGASTRAGVRDFVAGIGTESPAYTGVTGAIAFDENGDAVNKDVAVGMIRSGRLVSARPAGS